MSNHFHLVVETPNAKIVELDRHPPAIGRWKSANARTHAWKKTQTERKTANAMFDPFYFSNPDGTPWLSFK
jgi:hypothetical protein